MKKYGIWKLVGMNRLVFEIIFINCYNNFNVISVYINIFNLCSISVLAMCVAVILFGIKASQDHGVKLSFDDNGVKRFGWSYLVAAASAALSLVTSGVYGCASRID
jgi:hypothetical protein